MWVCGYARSSAEAMCVSSAPARTTACRPRGWLGRECGRACMPANPGAWSAVDGVRALRPVPRELVGDVIDADLQLAQRRRRSGPGSTGAPTHGEADLGPSSSARRARRGRVHCAPSRQRVRLDAGRLDGRLSLTRAGAQQLAWAIGRLAAQAPRRGSAAMRKRALARRVRRFTPRTTTALEALRACSSGRARAST
jgi:hypothetical protein